MSGTIIHTIRCKECPECRQVTLQKGDVFPQGIVDAMKDHVAREHSVGEEPKDGNQK